MNSSSDMIPWHVKTAAGASISTILPRTVRTFPEFVAVDVYCGDSDPVYWAVAGARLRWGDAWATRFSVAMLAYYHTGIALEAAEYSRDDFWAHLASIYATAPRGSARRHFRGDAGRSCLKSMYDWSPDPDDFFTKFPNHYAGVSHACESKFMGFGAYFQLKVCDFKDRCLNQPITSWSGLESNLPTAPEKALKVMYPGVPTAIAFKNACAEVAKSGAIYAAPHFDRLVGPAEIETSLCGWKTTKFGGNWFGADILDKRQALDGYGGKAAELLTMFPPLVPKGTFLCYL